MICIAEAYGRGSDLSKGTALTCSLTNKTTLSCACSPENGQYALISQPLSNLVFNCTRCHRNLLRQPHCGNVSVHEDSHHIILSRSQEFPGKDYYCHIHQCIAVGGYHGQDRAGDRTPVTSSGMGQNGTHKSTSDAKGTETVAVDGLGLGLGIVGLVSVAIALGFLVRFCWKKRVKKIKQGGGLMNECVPGSVQSSRSILTEPASDA
ncbi:uncharacterized protein [Heptranchias perlo]|uniref:uncharacterized protein isoform X2 n=1 Tax=Heptranchias perlo TaxID=212740 RepID=UPI00355A3D98